MIFYSLSNAAPEPSPGMRAWTPAERARLTELLAEVDEATARKKAGSASASASAKGKNHDWDRLFAEAMAPERLRLVEKAKA